MLARCLVSLFSVGMMVFGTDVIFSQDYPTKPIRIITAAAGGGSDFIARQVAQGVSGPLAQPLVVDNRTAVLAAEAVSKASPDGYTLYVGGSLLWLGPLLRTIPYAASDFAPISLLSRDIQIFVVHPSMPVKSIKELIALAKAKPGELNYSSTSAGGPTHLGMELFKSMAGVNIVQVAYKGNAMQITGVISGEVQLTIIDVGAVMPQVKSGKLRALAVTSAEPSALAPGLPTVAGSGLPGFETVGMTGIFAPAKTPAAIINRLNQEVVRVFNRADVKERVLNAGSEAVGNSPEQFAAIINSDAARMGRVIKDAGIKAD